MANGLLEISADEAQIIKQYRQAGNRLGDFADVIDQRMPPMTAPEVREEEYRQELQRGAGYIAKLVQDGYDARLADVATSMKLLLGPQFNVADFLGQVGRVRLRKLEPITLNLTDALGNYIVAPFVVTAPADRHQLVMSIAFEIQGTDAAGVVEYRDMAQLDAAGILTVERPQSDTVGEAWSDHSQGAQPLETDGLVVRPGGIYHRKRVFGFDQMTPGGIPQGIMYSFAGLLMLNTMTLTLQNLAAAGLTTPSGTLLKATLHTYVFDCIKGGK